jgi:hypothetical protein
MDVVTFDMFATTSCAVEQNWSEAWVMISVS